MTERIDHAALAARAIGTAFSQTEFEEATSITHAMIANARATLALAEQQRIANLIALGMYTNADGSRLAQHAVAVATRLSSVALRDDIREGLGL